MWDIAAGAVVGLTAAAATYGAWHLRGTGYADPWMILAGTVGGYVVGIIGGFVVLSFLITLAFRIR